MSRGTSPIGSGRQPRAIRERLARSNYEAMLREHTAKTLIERDLSVMVLHLQWARDEIAKNLRELQEQPEGEDPAWALANVRLEVRSLVGNLESIHQRAEGWPAVYRERA